MGWFQRGMTKHNINLREIHYGCSEERLLEIWQTLFFHVTDDEKTRTRVLAAIVAIASQLATRGLDIPYLDEADGPWTGAHFARTYQQELAMEDAQLT